MNLRGEGIRAMTLIFTINFEPSFSIIGLELVSTRNYIWCWYKRPGMTIRYFCHDATREGGGTGPRLNVIMTLIFKKIVWKCPLTGWFLLYRGRLEGRQTSEIKPSCSQVYMWWVVQYKLWCACGEDVRVWDVHLLSSWYFYNNIFLFLCCAISWLWYYYSRCVWVASYSGLCVRRNTTLLW